MKWLIWFALALLPLLGWADTARVAAAADLRYAFAEIATLFTRAHPEHLLELIYGSSGKFMQQIENGAPFDLYFSADIQLPQKLVASGQAVAPVTPYALGRIVIWSAQVDASQLTLQDLVKPAYRKVAIAAPEHAPYGARAKEALQHAGVWDAVSPKLVFGENISHTAQIVEQQVAEVGIIALSLAVSDTLRAKGRYALIPASWHKPLEQGFVLTTYGRHNAAALALARFMGAPAVRDVMRRYGFLLPGDTP